MCLVPDGDLFEAISAGRASVVTDHIDDASPRTGIELGSGDELEADLIVTATGLNLLALGGMTLAVDGEDVDLSETDGLQGHDARAACRTSRSRSATRTRRGRSSATSPASTSAGCSTTWTSTATRQCVPVEPDPSVAPEPFIDFNSGYVLRSIDKFPKQGSTAPWRLYQNYPLDILTLRHGNVDDGAMQFSPSPSAPHARVTSPASAATRPAG